MLTSGVNPAGVVGRDGQPLATSAYPVSEANQMAAQVKAALVFVAISGVSFLVDTGGEVADGEPSLLHVRRRR